MEKYNLNITGRSGAGVCPKCKSKAAALLDLELSDGSRIKRITLCESCARKLYASVKSRNEAAAKESAAPVTEPIMPVRSRQTTEDYLPYPEKTQKTGKMQCPKCGRQLPEGSAFCQYCGARIGNEAVKANKSGIGDSISNSKQPAVRKDLLKYLSIGIVAIALIVAGCVAIPKLISSSGNSGNSVKNFQIEGTWKNIGNDTCAQIQHGSVVKFDGTNCNVYSPMDTYAFYKDGSNYHLTCTSFFAHDSMEFVVTVKDKNHISMDYYGRGETVVELERVS